MSYISSSMFTTMTSLNSRNGFVGLASGINTNEIIEKMTMSTRTKLAQLLQRQTKVAWRMESYQSVTSQLIDFRNKFMSTTNASSMRNASFFQSAIITANGVNSSAVTVTGPMSSALDSFSIKSVDRLASTSALTSTNKSSNNEIRSQDLMGYINDGMTRSRFEGERITLAVDGRTHVITLRNVQVDQHDPAANAQHIKDALNAGLKEAGLENTVQASVNAQGRMELNVIGRNREFLEITAVDTNISNRLGLIRGQTGGGVAERPITAIFDIQDPGRAQATIHNTSLNETLRGKFVTFNLDGVNKTINFNDVDFREVNDGSNGQPIVTAAQVLQDVADYLNNKLRDAFGMDADGVRQKVSVSVSDGVLDIPGLPAFNPVNPHPGSAPVKPAEPPVLTDFPNVAAFNAAHAAWTNAAYEDYELTVPKPDPLVITDPDDYAEALANWQTDAKEAWVTAGNAEPVQADYNNQAAYNAAYLTWASPYMNQTTYSADLETWQDNYDTWLAANPKPDISDIGTIYADQDEYDAALAVWQGLHDGWMSGNPKPDRLDDVYKSQVDGLYSAAATAYNVAKDAYDDALALWQGEYDQYLLDNEDLINAHAGFNGGIVFRVADATSVLSVAGGSEWVIGNNGSPGILGIDFRDANRLLTDRALLESNLNSDVKDLLEAVGFGDLDTSVPPKYANSVGMTINGTDFAIYKDRIVVNEGKFGARTYDFTSGTTMRDITNVVNNSDAGVRMQYNSTTDSYSLIATESGSMGRVEVEGDFADALFGAARTVRQGEDAVMTVSFDNGATVNTITRNSNNFTLNGMNITINSTFAAGAGQDITFSAKPNTDVVVDGIKEIIASYNAMIENINKLHSTRPDRAFQPLTTEQKKELSKDEIEAWEAKAREGLLFSDPLLSSLLSELRFAFSSPVGGASLHSIGIRSGSWQDGGKLTIDEAALRRAIENDSDRVADIFTKSLTGTASATNPESGIFARLDFIMDKYTSTIGTRRGLLIERAGHESSPLSLTNNALQREMKSFDDQIKTMQNRLFTQETRYLRQFARMESFISAMNQQSMWLAQAFAPNYGNTGL